MILIRLAVRKWSRKEVNSPDLLSRLPVQRFEATLAAKRLHLWLYLCRHLQQPVHGVGQEPSEAGPQSGWRRSDRGGADPRPGGVLWPDAGSAQRWQQIISSCFSKVVVSFERLKSLIFLLPSPTEGYWPSYNVPFHHKIYTLSGYGQMWEEYGEDFSYDLCPRAKIFRRDQADVKDLDSLKHIMRFNGEWLCV